MARIGTERPAERGEVIRERTRRLALMQSEFGPWVPTTSIRKPHLKVTGLKDSVVTVFQRTALGECRHEFSKNGVFELVPALWTRVVCTPRCKTVICVVISDPAD